MALNAQDKRNQLAMALAQTIAKFTTQRPMTIFEILEALLFVAGHASAQKAARDSVPSNLKDPRLMRDWMMATIDRGIDEGMVDRTGGLIGIPHNRRN
jgi:hypothetical protein